MYYLFYREGGSMIQSVDRNTIIDFIQRNPGVYFLFDHEPTLGEMVDIGKKLAHQEVMLAIGAAMVNALSVGIL
jgi:rRNA pseudouridine-1189 N-methylase Emg1 (Nep1/Mra1 family)